MNVIMMELKINLFLEFISFLLKYIGFKMKMKRDFIFGGVLKFKFLVI